MNDKVIRKISKTPICGIYQITNKINNKIYIGQSIDIERRWNQHMYGKGSVVLMNAITKYGLDNFEFKILETIEFTTKNEVPVTTNPLQKMREVFAFTSKDCSEDKLIAFLYAIVMGWDDDCYEELKSKHNWSDEYINVQKEWHKNYNKAWNLFIESISNHST
jgi:hypothetical protein